MQNSSKELIAHIDSFLAVNTDESDHLYAAQSILDEYISLSSIQKLLSGLELSGRDLEWAVLSKLAIYIRDAISEALLLQILLLNEDIEYWKVMRSTVRWRYLYLLQCK